MNGFRFVFLSSGLSDFCIKWFVVRERARILKFRHSKSDVPVYILKKIHMTTSDAIEKISSITGIPADRIGYAGLKDKYDETYQYVSFPSRVDEFSSENLELKFAGFAKSKLKPGHLDGNCFDISVSGRVDTSTIKWLSENQIYNYFGLQRFGSERKNHVIGMKLSRRGAKPRTRMEKFMIHAYQSYLFNEAINILHPDVPDEIPLPGSGAEPLDVQQTIMENHGVRSIPEKGVMRKSMLGPLDISFKNRVLSFCLPKSAYATVVLQELVKRSFDKVQEQCS